MAQREAAALTDATPFACDAGKHLAASHLGKYWEVLSSEEGQPLYGKLKRHLTRAGNLAY